ncbi:Anamorsin [Macleaya cordata]|uniref:Anamorsin n=1 Tax=Macleaya cordata TaxID=56857 RepID=A0A200PNH7_MACCD|nr:Anamorsin [Macleaya cordata]
MEFQDGVLIITDSISVNATVVEWTLQHFSVELKDLRIVTQASLLEGNLYFKSSSLNAVISISEKPGFHTQLWLLELAKVLKPGGSVVLQEPSFFEGNKEIVLRESKSSLERNLLFAGFSSLECSECLDHIAEINSSTSTQNFELIAIHAKRPWDTNTSFDIHNRPMQKGDNSIDSVASTTQQQFEDMDDLIDEDTFFTAEDLKKQPDLPLDNNTLLRERIRERNRLYQRRRRARMTEEQRERERERRRQYMQSRRVQPISYEMRLPPLPISYERPKDCEQGPLCGQQLRESQGIEMEKNQVMGEAGEAL